MNFLYEQFIANKQKAIVGFVVGFVATYIAQHGFNIDMSLGQVLENLLYGLIGYVSVYLKENK